MNKILTILVPVYQNELNLRQTVNSLREASQSFAGVDSHILFVDDGSTDRSSDLLDDFQKEDPNFVSVIHLSRNFGQTPAIQVGLKYATGDCVGIMSADLQEDPQHFKTMIDFWLRGEPFVIGERAIRNERRVHQFISNIYWKLVKRFAFPHFPENGYDYCLIDRKIVDLVNETGEKNTSIFVLLYWFGFVPKRVPIERRTRELGASQWNLKKKIIFTLDTLIGFTLIPARTITFCGFSFAIFCLLYLVGLLIQWFTVGRAPEGWMTVVSLILLASSSILFSLGIIAEYLLRILAESKNRPLSVVRSTKGNHVRKAFIQ